MSKSVLTIVAVWCLGVCFLAIYFGARANASETRPPDAAQVQDQLRPSEGINANTLAPITPANKRVATGTSNRKLPNSLPRSNHVEISTVALLALGLVALGLTRRKARQ